MATLEVCVESVESAVNAYKGGAIRLELCSALSLGGLTPTIGLLQVIKQEVKIPVFVMIRPRAGNFVYDDNEIVVMKQDIQIFREFGADGFVFGVLNPDSTINKAACQILVEAASLLPCTFHRAFDVVNNPLESLEQVIELKFNRILTSGQKPNALLGKELIKELVKKANHRIVIMAGAGITVDNVGQIVADTGVKEVHGSASQEFSIPSNHISNIDFGIQPEETKRRITTTSNVEHIIQSLRMCL